MNSFNPQSNPRNMGIVQRNCTTEMLTDSLKSHSYQVLELKWNSSVAAEQGCAGKSLTAGFPGGGGLLRMLIFVV